MLHTTVETRLNRAIAAFCQEERLPRTVNEVTLTTTLARYVVEEFLAWNVDADVLTRSGSP